MSGAAECDRRLREIFSPRPGDETPSGALRRLDGDLASARGVIHVVAAGRRRDGGLAAIAVGPRAPRSATDRFLLGVARARGDAILTTGSILRAEPDVTHALGAASDEAIALADWRRSRVGKAQPPLSVVLTTGDAVDLAHPLLRSAARAVIVTGRAAAARLTRAAARVGIEVVGRDAPGPRDTIAYLRGERACTTITVEAGPSTTRALYETPLAVDELMLSVYEESPLARPLDAGELPRGDRLDTWFAARSPLGLRVEESGRWSFRRFRRD